MTEVVVSARSREDLNRSSPSNCFETSVLDDWATACEQLDNKHDQCQQKNKVNVGSERVKADPAKKPKHEKNYKDCPEHVPLLNGEWLTNYWRVG
jgi:hypothetical protein